MIQLLPYNRRAAVAYAHKWAYSRNPAFYDFSEIGGDCTNFASQCLYAGTGIMTSLRILGGITLTPQTGRRHGQACNFSGTS